MAEGRLAYRALHPMNQNRASPWWNSPDLSFFDVSARSPGRPGWDPPDKRSVSPRQGASFRSQVEQPVDFRAVEPDHNAPVDIDHWNALLAAALHHVTRCDRIATDVHIAESDAALAEIALSMVAV